MKAIRSLSLVLLTLLLIMATGSAISQTSFRAVLTPIIPTAENSWIKGAAAFELNGDYVQFTISLGLEDVVPAVARISGSQSSTTFDLGTPLVTIHSPGPWPNGYDGSTAFFGSFTLPASLRTEFVEGRTTLFLLGSRVGDFQGPILPAPAPQIVNLSRQGSMLRIHFAAQSPYRYTLEAADSITWANPVGLMSVPALSLNLDVMTLDNISSTGSRFYRIRRTLCCDP